MHGLRVKRCAGRQRRGVAGAVDQVAVGVVALQAQAACAVQRGDGAVGGVVQGAQPEVVCVVGDDRRGAAALPCSEVDRGDVGAVLDDVAVAVVAVGVDGAAAVDGPGEAAVAVEDAVFGDVGGRGGDAGGDGGGVAAQTVYRNGLRVAGALDDVAGCVVGHCGDIARAVDAVTKAVLGIVGVAADVAAGVSAGEQVVVGVVGMARSQRQAVGIAGLRDAAAEAVVLVARQDAVRIGYRQLLAARVPAETGL